MKKQQKISSSAGFAVFFSIIVLAVIAATGWLMYQKHVDLEVANNDLELVNAKNGLHITELQKKLSRLENQVNQEKDSNLTFKTEIDASESLYAETQLKLENALKQLKDIQQQSGLDAKEIEKRRRANALLKQQLSNSDINISNLKSRFTVFEMKQEILFNQGEAELKEKGQQALSALANIFRQFPDRQIAIQGHTDNQPLSSATRKKFSSNWDLAANRASSAIDYLQNIEHIKPERMILVSYSQYRPIQSNATAEGRANNRRIEIILMPRDFDFFRETTD